MNAPALVDRPNRLPIYLDNQSTTPIDPRVLEAMLPYFTEHFGNPHSESHVYGKNAAVEMEGEAARIRGLRDRLQSNLMRRVGGLTINGDTVHRLPGNLNLSFPGLTAPDLIEACPSVAMSTGSACTSATVEPSYVLRALGLTDALANGSIRLGLGRFTTAAEIDFAVDALAAAATRLSADRRVTEGAAPPT